MEKRRGDEERQDSACAGIATAANAGVAFIFSQKNLYMHNGANASII
jgi:hypothetical protein